MRYITECKRLMAALAVGAVALSAAAASPDTAAVYAEKWRPQYHFTPAHRWIGDPCGLVYFDGKYHAYSWGAAESSDLLHWTEINQNAIDMPEGTAPFTGSVVVDRDNTAGYGEDAFIAAFTSFDEQTKKQSQSIAFSRDGGRNFQYYDLNPVVDIWSTEFRDPTVLWDDATGRWIMLVAKALEKKVAFYASPDLKHWEWISEFGPAGDSDRSWECPDMFRLPVEGSDSCRWVLLVSVNWAREQYFVGDFDGTRFIPDNPSQAPLYVDAGLDYYASRTFADYDGTLPGVYSIGWVSTWDYAQMVPTTYGKGVWSLPRELSLRATPDGLRLVQKPVEALKGLKGAGVRLDRRLKAGVTRLPQVSDMTNQYELEARLPVDKADRLGFILCEGEGQSLVISYDTRSETLLLDRTGASEVEIPKFERVAFAKVAPVDETVSLDIYVDKSVVEVYANGGECVMTALVFPADNATGASVFSLNGGSRIELTAYPVDSVWR